jgi:hypothetical protein
VARAEAQFELSIQALDRFTQPFTRFGALVDRQTAGIRRFGEEMGRAQRRISASMGLPRLGQAFGGLGKGLKNVGTEASALAMKLGALGLAAGAIGAGIYAAIRQYTDAGDEAVKAAQQAGIATEAWQEMAYAADLSGLNAEQLQGAYNKLQRSMVGAANGSKNQAAAFKALGIELINNEGQLKANDTVMMELADAFAVLPNGAQKTALAMEIFGKSGAKLLPFLNTGTDGLKDLRREANEYGLVFGNEASKASEEFNDNVSRLQYRVKGLVLSLGKEFLPVAQEVVGMFSSLIDENRELIKVKIAEFAQKIISLMPKIKEGISKIIPVIQTIIGKGLKMVEMVGGWGNVAKIAGGILAGPLVKSILGLIGPIKSVGIAMMTTPVGLIMGAVTGVILLMEKMGALEPFVEGLTEGFSLMRGVIGEAFQTLLDSLSGLFGSVGENLTDVNGQINPEGWKEMGKVIAEFTGGTLAELIKGLAKAVELFTEIGKGLGVTAGKVMFGDNEKKDLDNQRMEEARQMMIRARESGNQKDVDDALRLGQAAYEDQLVHQKGPGRFSYKYDQVYQEINASKESEATSSILGPPALPAGRVAPMVQETKHTEEKVERVQLNLTTPPGFGVSTGGQLPNNVSVSSSPGMIGQQNTL